MLLGPTIIYPNGDFAPSDDVIQCTAPFRSARAVEANHLEHFKRLVQTQMPANAFHVASYGPDPLKAPDFLIYRDMEDAAKPFGLELTTFGIPTEVRQQNQWVFSHWHSRLLASYEEGRLGGLSGMKFDISFGDLSGPPPEKVDDVAFAELVDALEGVAKTPRSRFQLTFGTASPVSESGYWPEGSIAGGSIFWSLSGYSDSPFNTSALAQKTGFDLELTVREHKSHSDVVQDMNRTIEAKDVPENRELLIVAGGPTRSGKCFAASAMMAHRVMENWEGPVATPLHLRRVYLDIWGTEKVHLLYQR